MHRDDVLVGVTLTLLAVFAACFTLYLYRETQIQLAEADRVMAKCGFAVKGARGYDAVQSISEEDLAALRFLPYVVTVTSAYRPQILSAPVFSLPSPLPSYPHMVTPPRVPFWEILCKHPCKSQSCFCPTRSASSPSFEVSPYSASSFPSGSIVGNTNTKVFHLPACGHIAQMSPEHKVYFRSVGEAMANGFRPCEHCFGGTRTQRKRR